MKYGIYQLIDGILFQKKYDNVFRGFLRKDYPNKMLFELHDGSIGGHYEGETTIHNVLGINFSKYSHAYARKRKLYSISARKEMKLAIPLQVVTAENTFEHVVATNYPIIF